MKRMVALLFVATLLAACSGPPAAEPIRIAFVSNRDGSHDIHIMNADSAGQTNLTNNLAGASSPAWCP